MKLGEISSGQFAELCAGDSEFMMLARYWNGGLRLGLGEHTLCLNLNAGRPAAGDGQGTGWLSLSGAGEVWDKVLAACASARVQRCVHRDQLGAHALRRLADAVAVLPGDTASGAVAARGTARGRREAGERDDVGEEGGDVRFAGGPLRPCRDRRPGLPRVFRGDGGRDTFASAAHRGVTRVAVAAPVRDAGDHRSLPPDSLRSAVPREVATAGRATLVGVGVPTDKGVRDGGATGGERGAGAGATGVHGLLRRRAACAGPGALPPGGVQGGDIAGASAEGGGQPRRRLRASGTRK